MHGICAGLLNCRIIMGVIDLSFEGELVIIGKRQQIAQVAGIVSCSLDEFL